MKKYLYLSQFRFQMTNKSNTGIFIITIHCYYLCKVRYYSPSSRNKWETEKDNRRNLFTVKFKFISESEKRS